VLIVASLLEPHVGGTETFVKRLVPQLQARGMDVVTLACAHPQSRSDIALPARFLGAAQWPVPTGGLRELWRAVGRADLVIANNQRQFPALLACLVAAWRGVPCVLFPHCVESELFATRGRVGPATRAYFAFAGVWDRLLVPLMLRRSRPAVLSRREEQMLLERWNAQPTRLCYPVAPPAFVPADGAARDGTLRLVWAARFVDQKAPRVALDAARAAAERVPVALDFYGDGPLREPLEQEARGLAWVRFHGAVTPEEVRSAQARAGAVLSSSVAEGAQISILEALCAGIPAVVTAAGDAPDYYPPELAWACVPPDDPAALGAALVRFAEDPDGVAASFRANGERLLRLHGPEAEQRLCEFIAGVARDHGR
jgi:alpha-1,6-mannosyltransferase